MNTISKTIKSDLLFTLVTFLSRILDRKRYFKNIRMAQGSFLGLCWSVYWSFYRSMEYASITIGLLRGGKVKEIILYKQERSNNENHQR